jgi:hypothetical protein
MSVSYVSSPNSSVMGDFLAAQGVPSRRGRQIVQVELGIKGQKAVRDIRIQGTNTPCCGKYPWRASRREPLFGLNLGNVKLFSGDDLSCDPATLRTEKHGAVHIKFDVTLIAASLGRDDLYL